MSDEDDGRHRLGQMVMVMVKNEAARLSVNRKAIDSSVELFSRIQILQIPLYIGFILLSSIL